MTEGLKLVPRFVETLMNVNTFQYQRLETAMLASFTKLVITHFLPLWTIIYTKWKMVCTKIVVAQIQQGIFYHTAIYFEFDIFFNYYYFRHLGFILIPYCCRWNNMPSRTCYDHIMLLYSSQRQ